MSRILVTTDVCISLIRGMQIICRIAVYILMFC